VSRFLFLLKTRLDAGSFFCPYESTNKYECTKGLKTKDKQNSTYIRTFVHSYKFVIRRDYVLVRKPVCFVASRY